MFVAGLVAVSSDDDGGMMVVMLIRMMLPGSVVHANVTKSLLKSFALTWVKLPFVLSDTFGSRSCKSITYVELAWACCLETSTVGAR